MDNNTLGMEVGKRRWKMHSTASGRLANPKYCCRLRFDVLILCEASACSAQECCDVHCPFGGAAAAQQVLQECVMRQRLLSGNACGMRC